MLTRDPPPRSARLRGPPARGDRAGSRRRHGAFPTQSLGNRGADVRAVQGLLRAPRHPGRHRRGLRGGDRRAGQDVPGRERPDRQRASSARRPGRSSSSALRPGSTGEAVKVAPAPAQREAARRPRGDGVYGTATRNGRHRLPEAHRDDPARQRRPGDLAQARCGTTTTRRSARPPCATTASATARRTGATGAAIGQLEAAATAFVETGPRSGRRSATSAASTAGTSPATRPTRSGSTSTSARSATTRTSARGARTGGLASYDRGATRALIKAIRAAAPGHVKLIYFNDPVLISEGLTTWFAGHDDHLHVRYCETSYPSPRTAAERLSGSASDSVTSLVNRPGWPAAEDDVGRAVDDGRADPVAGDAQVGESRERPVGGHAFDLRVRAARRLAAGQAGPERRPPERRRRRRASSAARRASATDVALDEVDDREVAVEAADAPAEHERPPGTVRGRREVLARARQAADPSPTRRRRSGAKTSFATPPGSTPPA